MYGVTAVLAPRLIHIATHRADAHALICISAALSTVCGFVQHKTLVCTLKCGYYVYHNVQIIVCCDAVSVLYGASGG